MGRPLFRSLKNIKRSGRGYWTSGLMFHPLPLPDHCCYYHHDFNFQPNVCLYVYEIAGIDTQKNGGRDGPC